MLFIYLIILIIITVCVLLGRIVFRRLPDLKILDISAIPQEKQESAKIKILEAKFMRQKDETGAKIEKVAKPLKEKLAGWTGGMKEKIAVLENKYKHQEAVVVAKIKSESELLAEAKAFLEAEKFVDAEKSLIEILSRDKKSIAAYELLAKIYRQNKSYEQAEEIIRYLIKLMTLKYRKNKGADTLKKDKLEEAEDALIDNIDVDNGIARYYDDLAKVYELMEKKDKALDSYLKASTIEPNNPRLLDRVIDLAIAVGDRGLAKKMFKRLKEINPENAKLERFSAALEKLK